MKANLSPDFATVIYNLRTIIDEFSYDHSERLGDAGCFWEVYRVHKSRRSNTFAAHSPLVEVEDEDEKTTRNSPLMTAPFSLPCGAGAAKM